LALDINDPEFAKQFMSIIDVRVESKFKELIKGLSTEKVGKVAVDGNGSTIQVYIGNSTTAVDIKNPRSFSLTAGQLVAVAFPNFKNDSTKYIDRIL
jgi:hypothetical protein